MLKVLDATAIRYLMYAMVCTKLDLAFAVSNINKYMVNPNIKHWNAAKWIFKYLKGSLKHEILFAGQQGVSQLQVIFSHYHAAYLLEIQIIICNSHVYY